ncbi:ROK family protein [Eubacterium sp.]|uniref:ROK family protein n=1 Tax=Eubacterium sp. TaxID=142586 RepID=UPI002FC5E7AC
MNYAIGIDIGGTNTRVALVNHGMEMVKRVQFPTVVSDPEATIKKIEGVLAELSSFDICGIGMSCPGPLDLRAGTIIVTPNLDQSWFGFPLVDALSQATGLPVFLENDANLAGLAEAVVGEGKDFCYVQFLTISTGIGAGFVIDKQIYQGAHGFGGEVAAACLWQDGPAAGILPPGAIEAIASGTAITHRARACGLTVAHAGEVAALDAQGDAIAHSIMEDTKNYLANFIGIIYALMDPEIVILGGSVAMKTPGFVSDVEKRVAAKVLPVLRPTLKIVPTTLNEDSGLLGAAYLAFSKAGLSA